MGAGRCQPKDRGCGRSVTVAGDRLVPRRLWGFTRRPAAPDEIRARSGLGGRQCRGHDLRELTRDQAGTCIGQVEGFHSVRKDCCRSGADLYQRLYRRGPALDKRPVQSIVSFPSYIIGTGPLSDNLRKSILPLAKLWRTSSNWLTTSGLKRRGVSCSADGLPHLHNPSPGLWASFGVQRARRGICDGDR